MSSWNLHEEISSLYHRQYVHREMTEHSNNMWLWYHQHMKGLRWRAKHRLCVTCCCMTHTVCIQYRQLVAGWFWPLQVAHSYLYIFLQCNRKLQIFPLSLLMSRRHMLFYMLCSALVIQWAAGSGSWLRVTHHRGSHHYWLYDFIHIKWIQYELY